MTAPRRYRLLRSPAPLLLLLAGLASPGRSAPPGVAGTLPLVLKAPSPRFLPVEGDRVVPVIEGFGSTSRPGEPKLPVQILRVAIPEGSIPELRILSAPSESLGRRRVAPAPRADVRDRDRESAGDKKHAAIYAEDADVFARDADFPGEPARLGAIGYLREQRYVEVIFTPLQYNPAGRRLLFYPEVRAEVRFKEAPGGERVEARPFRADPFFEGTYRRALVNYEQGKLFRKQGGRQSEPPIEEGSSPSTLRATAATAAPGGPRYKISVSREGIYSLSYSDIQSAAPDLLPLNPLTYSLSAEGVEVPIFIRSASGSAGDNDGVFDPGDTLEFYGRPKGGPPAILNFSGPGSLDVYAANDFTDTQVYWLTSDGAPGSHRRIPEVGVAPLSGYASASDFEHAAVWEENNIYVPLDGNDPFFSQPSLLAGSTQAQRDLTLPLPGMVATSIPARVSLRVRGGTSLASVPLDHDLHVWLNGDLGGARDFFWDGETMLVTDFDVSQSILSPSTIIHVMAPVRSGVSVDRQYLDTVTVRYRRAFDSVGDALAFTYSNQNTRFNVRGLSGPPAIYEVTRAVPGTGEADPVRLTGAAVAGAPATATFEVANDPTPGAPATRSFAVAGQAGLLRPLSIEPATAPVLHDPTNSADIIVIGTPGTIDDSPGGALQALLTHRLLHQGLTSRVVFMSQIYEEFSYGMRDPNAIRSFLAYAFDFWRGTSGAERAPSFVLLVGDATPDYKNNLARADWVDQVPTPMMLQTTAILGYYSSDNWLASFRGTDQLPDIHLGRISTRTPAASAAVFDKIRRYEESPPPGLWKGRALLLTSDGNFPGESDDFEAIETQIATKYFPAAPYSVPSPPLYFAQPPWNSTDSTGFKNAVISQLQGGAAVLSFVGHGAFDLWGANQVLFTTQDAAALNNGGSIPFMVTMNCLTGGFHSFPAAGSLGEGMTNNPNGGVIATVAPSGLSALFLSSQQVVDSLFEPLFGNHEERLVGAAADGLRAGLWTMNDILDVQSFTLLGDPATVLAMPAPPPPTGLSAAPGNATVQLDWSPPPVAPALYRVYRAASATGSAYAAVTCDPLSSTSCVDRSVANATTYYYYVVSVDSDGFEGRASNFNTDCDAGPDCVKARPLNPGPPAIPTGLRATDPGSGGRLVVSWQANTETDLKSYVLRYHTDSGPTTQITYGPGVTSTILSGLSNGVRYLLSLSASNTSGHESVPSPEISAVALLFEGIAPPRAISDLTISRSGADLVLAWSRPVVDIYGRPTTVLKYTVYRGTTPGFQPFLSTPLAIINSGSVTTYTDPGAAGAPSNYYYLVTATDGGGLVSGAGRELPNGIDSLMVTQPAAGTIRLAWAAVFTDVTGYATVIDHYQIHASTHPFARSTIGSSTLLMDNVRLLTVDFPMPSAATYYSVIAVDNRGNLSPF